MPDPSARARVALDGLSIGDALGERYFDPANISRLMGNIVAVPPGPWRWTDDTAMACSIVEVLEARGTLDEDALAAAFARRYQAEPNRGYGAGAHRYFRAVAAGTPWRDAASALFNGQGSLGNGGAMRAAPVGAWFAGNLAAVVEEAGRSARPTHMHAEGVAGAIAVAVAAALAWEPVDGHELLAEVERRTPASKTRDGIAVARTVPFATSVEDGVAKLGNGSYITAMDTVPFALWSAARSLDDFPRAILDTIRGLGDIDTTCAIVGGVVAGRVGPDGVPADWRASREPVPYAVPLD
jgi:ADP-ribosylglycohydrolase